MDLQRKLETARARALMDYPFFGSLLCPMTLEESDKVPTLGTDGVKIFYNAEYLEGLDVDLITGCLIHEVLHPAFFHLTRRGTRPHIAWNIACDYAINPIIINEGLRLPEGALIDEKYDGWSADAVYNDLVDQHGSSEGEGWEIAFADSVSNGAGESFDVCGTGMFEDSSSTTSQRNELENEWKSRLVGAAEACKLRGTMPGAFEGLIDSFMEPQILWSEKLQRLARDYIKSKYFWLKPAKKYIDQGIYLGSYTKKKGIRTTVAVIDSSGTVSDGLLAQFGGELTELMTSCDIDEMYIVWVDTQVQNVQTYRQGDLPIVLEVKGRGGTAFEPAFEWVEENNIDPSLLIYFTDMCGSFPLYAPNYPVIWVAYESNKEYYEKDCTFGDVIEVD